VFKFLKPLPKTPGETAADDGAAASIIPAAVPAAVNGHAPGDDAPGGSLFDIASSADLEPIPGVLGMDEARAALAAVASARPRSMFFLAAPRSGAHREALAGLLAEQARGLAKADAVVAVCDFEWGAPRLLRLPAAEARLLARQVAEAVEMLAVTIPAAFDADSYKVARLALEEELR
jgi:AAA domain